MRSFYFSALLFSFLIYPGHTICLLLLELKGPHAHSLVTTPPVTCLLIRPGHPIRGLHTYICIYMYIHMYIF